MTTITPGAIEWKSYVVPVSISDSEPLPGHLAPLDRRHRWWYTKTDAKGHWYRCRACHRRQRVTSIATLLARKMRDAAHTLDEKLSETLFR